MSDLISRSALEKSIRAYADQVHCRGEIELANGILKSLAMVENAISQDAQPVVHAKWIPSSVDPADPYFRCSNCRHGRDSIYFQGDEYNFCPHCGAKMAGEENDA